MDTATDMLRQINEKLADLAAAPAGGLSEDSICEFTVELERGGRVVDGLRARAAADIEVRSGRVLGPEGLSDRHGFRTGAQLVEFLTRVGSVEARRRVRVGSATRPNTTLVGDTLPPRTRRSRRHSPPARSASTRPPSSSAASTRHRRPRRLRRSPSPRPSRSPQRRATAQV